MEQVVEEVSGRAGAKREAGGEAGQEMLWGQPLHLEASANKRVRPRYVRFFVWILILPFLFYVAAVPLVRSPSYLRWTPNLWTPRLDYAFNTADRNADVLIFGDSSAFLGVDPRLLNAELGVKSFVIPGTTGSLPYTGDMALRHYLATNNPPRVLVLYFAAWDMDYLHTPNLHPFEGVEMVVRHGSGSQILDFALRHPYLALTFPLRMYSMVLEKSKPSEFAQAHQKLPDDSGHFDYTQPVDPLTSSCMIPQIPMLSQRARTTIDQLVQQYSRRMKVVVYLAPMPACRNNAMIVDSATSSGESAPAVMPVQAFFGDGQFAHIEKPYLAQSSHLLAERLRQPLQQVGLTPAPTVQPESALSAEGR